MRAKRMNNKCGGEKKTIHHFAVKAKPPPQKKIIKLEMAIERGRRPIKAMQK